MDIQLTQGVPRRSNDAEIMIALNFPKQQEPKGKEMTIGIRNEGGQLYRTVTTRGINEYTASVQALLSIGMRDELADTMGNGQGFHAIFR